MFTYPLKLIRLLKLMLSPSLGWSDLSRESRSNLWEVIRERGNVPEVTLTQNMMVHLVLLAIDGYDELIPKADPKHIKISHEDFLKSLKSEKTMKHICMLLDVSSFMVVHDQRESIIGWR